MVERDASGKLTARSRAASSRLVRNPNWDPETDYRPAYLDAVTIIGGNTEGRRGAPGSLDGQGLVSGDSGTPPVELADRAEENRRRSRSSRRAVTRYVALNTTITPFDDTNVRKA